MKLARQLTVNAIERQVIEDRVLLDLNAPGKAIFTMINEGGPVEANQLVTFDVGYTSQAAMQRLFIGVVLKVMPVGNKRVKIFCKELSHALAFDVPLDLRHVTFRQVATDIFNKTGLLFAVPDGLEYNHKVPNFYNVGSGFNAVASLARVFDIKDFICQQQAGVVYVGAWDLSRWASIDDLPIPIKVFNEHGTDSAKVAAIPQLRPGMRINGRRLMKIDFAANHMGLTWKT